MHFSYIDIIFSIFNVISEEFKFSKVFWTRSTFYALILQLLIFLIKSTLLSFVFKINLKLKKKLEGQIWFWSSHTSPVSTSLQ